MTLSIQDRGCSLPAGHSVELPSHAVLSEMARDDPEAYEALRHQLIDNFIDCAPTRIRPRLQGIQFRVEAVRRLSRSALGSTTKISKLMWDSFLDLNGMWQVAVRAKAERLNVVYDATPTKGYIHTETARILEFRSPIARE